MSIFRTFLIFGMVVVMSFCVMQLRGNSVTYEGTQSEQISNVAVATTQTAALAFVDNPHVFLSNTIGGDATVSSATRPTVIVAATHPTVTHPVVNSTTKTFSLAPQSPYAVSPVVTPHLEVVAPPDYQPASTLLLAGAQGVPFTVVSITAIGGPATVKNIVIKRMGPGTAASFYAVGFIDVGNPNGLASDDTYQTRAGFTLAEGETRTLVVIASMQFDLTGHDGEEDQLAIARIDADVPVEGDFPVVGTTNTVNQHLSIGTIYASQSGFDPGLERNIPIKAHDVIFSALKLSVGNEEPILLKTATWMQAGSAGADDISNIRTYVVYKGQTTSYPTTRTGRLYSSDLAADENRVVVVDPGDVVEMYVAGDVGDNPDTLSGRTIDFDINADTDILGYGMNYQNLILAIGTDVVAGPSEGQFSQAGYPLYNAFTQTIVKQ